MSIQGITNTEDLLVARRKYATQKAHAKKRGIEFKFTFEQWCAEWGEKFKDRGVRSWQLGMCRISDQGAYEPGNVYLGTPARNGASKRMALENKRESSSAYCWPVIDRARITDEEETDEEYIARKMRIRTSGF